jgi:dienelactone hydrolase
MCNRILPRSFSVLVGMYYILGAFMATPIFGQTARIELHPIPTQTLSDHQFLTGAKDGTPALIAGELRLPVGAGPFPAVILIHGSGGVGSNVNRWAGEFNQLGVAAFIIDCFTGRGITSTIPDQSQLGSLAMIYDTYRALELLAKHPHIDKSRIAVMGFSKGGFAALYASMKRFQAYYAPPGVEFAAYLPFYARCDLAIAQDENVADRPIRIFHGEADDWVRVEPAIHYVARLKAAGKDVQITTFPGARHAYDSATYPEVFAFADAEVVSRCRVIEKDGYIFNLDTAKPFTHKDACITRGATVGSNLAAYEQTLAVVKSFLTATFKLAPVAK